MKIGISSTPLESYHYGGNLDGIGVYTKQIAQGLIDLSQDVLLYSFPNFGSSKTNSGKALPYSYPIAELAGLVSGGRSKIKLDHDVDIYHATDYKIVPMSCPVIATLYDSAPISNPEFANPRFRSLKNSVMKMSTTFADHIITISEFSKSEIMKYYNIPESKVSIVPCGVDKKWLADINKTYVDSILEKRRLKSGYFLFVGTLQPRKNIEKIILAHKLLNKDFRQKHPLVLVGRKGWRCNSLVTLIMDEVSKGTVHWLNNVYDFNELKALYHGSSAFVFPSLYEGFGLPVLEAFATGLPVVTSNTSALPEVSNGIAIEVEPNSEQQISDAMYRIVVDDEERAWRINAGIIRAKELSWEETAIATLDVYKKVVT